MAGFSLASGALDVGRGARWVLARPALYKWIAAPFLLTCILFIAAFWGAWTLALPAAASAAAALPGFLATIAAGLLKIILIALFIVGFFVLFVSVASVITAPFNEMLSEAIEVEVTGTSAKEVSPAGTVAGMIQGIVHALRRVALFLVLSLLLLVLGAVIPVVGTAASAILGVLVTARFAAFDGMDAVMARKGWSYGAKKKWLKAHSGRTLGIGLAITGLLAVPLVNLVALPLGAAASTLAYLDVPEGARRGNTRG